MFYLFTPVKTSQKSPRHARWGTAVCESGNERHTGPADSHVCGAALHALVHCPGPCIECICMLTEGRSTVKYHCLNNVLQLFALFLFLFFYLHNDNKRA